MNNLLVIKIGGNIVDDDIKLQSFLHAFSKLRENKILIHGGGKIATSLASRLGVEQTMVDGRRITDGETLRIVTMVYAGLINKNIVAKLQANGCNALGLCGADGNAIRAHKRTGSNIDYGFAGDIDEVNTTFLSSILENGTDLVIAPITHDKQGQLLNTNADTIAQEIATAMSDKFEVSLLYGFEKAGVLVDINDESTLIRHIDADDYKELRKKDVIFAGMIPKMDNAFAAINRGVKKVVIGRAEQLSDLVNGNTGTVIT